MPIKGLLGICRNRQRVLVVFARQHIGRGTVSVSDNCKYRVSCAAHSKDPFSLIQLSHRQNLSPATLAGFILDQHPSRDASAFAALSSLANRILMGHAHQQFCTAGPIPEDGVELRPRNRCLIWCFVPPIQLRIDLERNSDLPMRPWYHLGSVLLQPSQAVPDAVQAGVEILTHCSIMKCQALLEPRTAALQSRNVAAFIALAVCN